MYRSAGFFWQLGVTAAGAVLDYLIGRLANSPSVGTVCWAALTLVGPAILEFSKDLRKEPGSSTSSYPRSSSVLNLIRSAHQLKWTTVTRAFWAAALAAAAYYAFALAVIIFRFLAAGSGTWLGRGSPFGGPAALGNRGGRRAERVARPFSPHGADRFRARIPQSARLLPRRA